MEANWTSESEKPIYLDKVISVYNYGGSNIVINAAQAEVVESKYLIGVWKIKKRK